MGKLIDITGAIGTCYLGVPRNVQVCEAATRSRWNVRGHRSRHFHDLHLRIQKKPVPDANGGNNVVLWKHSDDSYKPYFPSTCTWDQTRERRATVFGAEVYGLLKQCRDSPLFFGWLLEKDCQQGIE
ncbi:hypothetical protein YC2023_068540 [Brassica napus]